MAAGSIQPRTPSSNVNSILFTWAWFVYVGPLVTSVIAGKIAAEVTVAWRTRTSGEPDVMSRCTQAATRSPGVTVNGVPEAIRSLRQVVVVIVSVPPTRA